jgi:uncharacterized protein YjbI with pentapeptide repeats
VKLAILCLAFFFQLTENALVADVQSDLLQSKYCPGCNLSEADLQDADLDGAYLEEANLTGAHLRKAHLNGADLKDVVCQSCDLSEADLQDADLDGAYLEEANLTEALLREANLDGADLQDAKLTRAHLDKTHLANAQLSNAKLDGAHLQSTLLTDADLSGADLTEAVLQSTELKGSKAYGAHLDRAIFDPISFPDIWSMRDVSGLDSIAWQDSPRALNQLRDEFKKAALWDQEKALTYALREQDRIRQGIAGRWFQKIFFEATSLWGASTSRPLVIMFILIPVFGLAYSVAIVRPGATRGYGRFGTRTVFNRIMVQMHQPASIRKIASHSIMDSISASCRRCILDGIEYWKLDCWLQSA